MGDAAIDRVLSALEEAAPAAAWRSRRPRLEHGDLLPPEDLGRVRDLGIVVVQNPLHLGIVELLAERFGADRFARMQPLRSLVEAGIPLALGSDTIAASVNPFLDLLLATLHPGRPEEALSREQAVTAYTAGSAYAELQEHRKGRLAPGQFADLAVLSRDIFTVEPLALLGTESLLTLVGGEVVWDAGVITPGAQP